MKSVLLSIRPKWCGLIASGMKTLEVRKTKPNIPTPFKCYIYQCLPKCGDWNDRDGRVIGEFVCDKIDVLFNTSGNPTNYMTKILPSILKNSALPYNEFQRYVGSRSPRNDIFGWHISDLKIYDKPKELRKFRKVCKYRNDDGSCRYYEIDCDCKKYDFNSDGSVNLVKCVDYIGRPPQSWCYVEELL